jgi:thymidylate synthase (FAD)
MTEHIRVPILDHGYVQLIETWGADERIIEAARMSTDKGFRTWDPYVECKRCGIWQLDARHIEDCNSPLGPEHDWRPVPKGDAGLLSFLYKNKHSTPFEFAGLVFEIQLPIFVVREWHRHRTQSYAEMSARYTPLPDFNYTPTVERCLVVSGANKQAGSASDAPVLTHEAALQWLEELADLYEHAQRVYDKGLRIGVPKELARLPVPVSRYTRMRASANLRNWLAFLTLRTDPAAQWEIRQFAHQVASVIAQCYPRTYELFVAGGHA